MDMGDYYLWGSLINAWSAQHPASPKFTQEPMSPEQKKIWDIYYGSLTNPTYQGNMPLVNSIARGVAMQGPPVWNSPKTSTGETGWAGNGGFDWGGYLKTAPGGGAGVGGGGTPPPPAGSPPPPAGSGGGTTPGAGGGAPDPFATLPDPGAKNNTNLELPPGATKASDLISRYGKSVAEIVGAFMTANPILGLKGAWDAFQAWRNGDTKAPGADQIAKIAANANQAGGIAGMTDPNNPPPYDPNNPTAWDSWDAWNANQARGGSTVSYGNQDTTATGNPLASGVPQESMDWSPFSRPGFGRGSKRQAV